MYRPLLLLLFQSHRLQSQRAGDEGDVRPFFHQPSDPPVIVILLLGPAQQQNPVTCICVVLKS